MVHSQIAYYGSRDRFGCTVLTATAAALRLSGAIDDSSPRVSGDAALRANPALVANAWAYATHEFVYRRLRAPEKRKSHRKQADHHAAVTRAIADLVDQLGAEHRKGWCSGCFAMTHHWRVDRMPIPPAAHLCEACGSPTSPCAAPRCKNMAIRSIGRPRLQRYCAEHRHEIPGFDKLGQRFAAIDDYAEWLEHDKRNLAKTTRIVGGSIVAAAVIAPAAFVAAPAIGGIIGSSFLGGSLSGAAATSHGLAILGGGSLAAGGLGMAGGTAVVTVVGAGLGGVLGVRTTAAYVGNDKSFRIEKLQDGSGPSVLLANGFLTEGQDGWGPWRRLIDKRYPDAAVYRVHWGSKELKALGVLTASGLGKAAAAKFGARLAGRASLRAAGKVPYVGGIIIAGSVVANPWSVALNRAGMTSVILADLIARTDVDDFVLVGHSLGARVMVSTAQLLGTRNEAPKLDAVHLLGAAVTAKGDWRTLNDAVELGVWNYRSTNDKVLRILYKNAQVHSSAAGVVGFRSQFPKIHDRNVTRTVESHSAYFAGVTLV